LKPLIEIKDLSYQYPDGKQALKGINLQVMSGEKVALTGANGAGKSTLLLHLNGILSGEGRIHIKGLELTKNNLSQIRAMVGIMFQNPDDQLFPNTVFEDVAFGPIYQGLDKTTIKERVTHALTAVDMPDYENRNPYHLSSGEKKRVAIATVLSMQPEILICDEPTAGLDPRARRELIAFLHTLPQTMLIATHDLDLVEQLTSRMVVMNGGKIVADDQSLTLLKDEAFLLNNGLR
jgi:cobalt/nickel transport system ATP-binding protein